jgi:EAL and modified HD-GYP domain-containing signal transduction protein
MYSFVARQPVFDRDLHTVAYELLFRVGLNNYFPDVKPEYATSQMISDQFLGTPLCRLVGEHLSLINFPYQMIIQGLADALPREKVVIEILEDAVPDDALLDAVIRLHSGGYALALDDFTMDAAWQRFFPYIKIIKFDIQASSDEDINQFLNMFSIHLHGIILLAEKVETHAEFEKYKQKGFSLFQGYFYSKPEIVKTKRLSHKASHLFQLLNAVNAPELDFDKIELILEHDLTLTYKILKYARNIIFRVSGITESEHLTLKNIVMYLGRKELSRFVSLACLTNLNNKNNHELYHLSLVRAKFCEVMVEKALPSCSPQDAFLCGLLSLLDAILETPIEDICQQLAISPLINDALVHKKGKLYQILRLACHFDRREWVDVKTLANTLDIPDFVAIDAMTVATLWADATIAEE